MDQPTSREFIPGTYEFAKRMMEEGERLKQEEEARKEALAAQKQADALAEIERRKNAFEAHRAAFGENWESSFIAQAQQLHGVFGRAIEEFAGATGDEKAKLYSAIALRAQNYCRMTMSTMLKLKEYSLATTKPREKNENEDPAIKEGQHAEMDAGGTGPAGGISPAVATVENMQA